MVKQLFFRSSIYFVGLLFVKFLTVLLFIFLARFLQPVLFGKLSYILTLVSLLTIVFDWGMVQWFQVHANQENERKLIIDIVQARIVTLGFSIALFCLYSFFTHVFSCLEIILCILILIPEALLSVADGYYLVHHQTHVIAVKQLSKYAAPLLFIVLFPNFVTVESILISFLASSIASLTWYIPEEYFQFSALSLPTVKKNLKESSSFATLLLASAFYSRGDALVLESELGHAALGVYSAGYRYLDAMSLFPMAFAQNLFHISAQKDLLDRQKILMMTLVMSVLGLFFGGILFFCSHFLTVSLLGQSYAGTEMIVKIFAVVTVLLFMNSPLSTLVQSSTLIKQFLPWGIGNTLLNIGLNILVIPLAGGVGAALVMLLTETTGLIINIYFVKQRLQTT